jgi:predicted RNase H-like nuclease (RuvC/YqgF family)
MSAYHHPFFRRVMSCICLGFSINPDCPKCGQPIRKKNEKEINQLKGKVKELEKCKQELLRMSEWAKSCYDYSCMLGHILDDKRSLVRNLKTDLKIAKEALEWLRLQVDNPREFNSNMTDKIDATLAKLGKIK